VLINHLALQVKLNFLRTTEIQIEARIIARNRIQVVWCVAALLTPFVERWLRYIDQTLLVQLRGTLVIAVTLGANTNAFGHVSCLAFEAFLF